MKITYYNVFMYNFEIMINSLLNYIHNHHIASVATVIILFTQIIIFICQLIVFKKQAKIAEKQNEIIQNQLLIDSKREHTVEIKSSVISLLKEKINKMPFIELEIPQFKDKDNNKWIINIENELILTPENFFEKVKLPNVPVAEEIDPKSIARSTST